RNPGKQGCVKVGMRGKTSGLFNDVSQSLAGIDAVYARRIHLAAYSHKCCVLLHGQLKVYAREDRNDISRLERLVFFRSVVINRGGETKWNQVSAEILIIEAFD